MYKLITADNRSLPIDIKSIEHVLTEEQVAELHSNGELNINNVTYKYIEVK